MITQNIPPRKIVWRGLTGTATKATGYCGHVWLFCAIECEGIVRNWWLVANDVEAAQ